MAGGKPVGGDVFDVRVVAFAGGSARTLLALQELFGLDRDAAQRLVDNVPLVVRRAAPANEAQSYVEVLRGMGAQVTLERPQPAPAGEGFHVPSPLAKPPPVPAALRVPAAPGAPPRAANAHVKAPPPPPRSRAADEGLPRPIVRAATDDLEFDLPAQDSQSVGEPVDREAPEPHSETKPIGGGGKRARNEIEFDGADSGRLELAVDSVRTPAAKRADDRSGSGAASVSAPAPGRPAAVSGSEQRAHSLSAPDHGAMSRGGGAMSRAAVVHKSGPAQPEPRMSRRALVLLRLLGALSIGAAGVWLDNSVVYGNANLVSVLAHALAIYQLGVGLRGMAH